MKKPANTLGFKLPVDSLPTIPVRKILIGGEEIPVYQGLISYVAPSIPTGLIEGASHSVYAFNFSDIVNYNGQTASTLGVNIGTTVEYALKDGKVIRIQLPNNL